MQIKQSPIFKYILTLLCGFFTLISYGQDTPEKKQIQAVFDQLVMAYGNVKSRPQLIVVQDSDKQVLPAKYEPDPKPNIQVDGSLVILFRTFGKDSLNALAVVLSHELAHYYSDHTFCSDYAYALKDQSKSLSDLLKSVSKQEKISKETEADQKGFFYAAAAGYVPFEVQSSVLDKIYAEYQYPDSLPGYPTKQQRVSIAVTAEKKAKDLYDTFQAGLKWMNEKNYEKAIEAFEEANSYIPFRENYNNMGVARALMALDLKDPDYAEKEYPDRFLYPFEIDNQSRLKKEMVRGVDYEKEEKINQLLLAAMTNLEEAIRLDRGYSKSYINLACVFDLLGNQDMAKGTIKKLPLEEQKTKEAQRILAIAYYHEGRIEEAEKIWFGLEKAN
jgi:tetratricopeptide (TPR) repeat protein